MEKYHYYNKNDKLYLFYLKYKNNMSYNAPNETLQLIKMIDLCDIIDKSANQMRLNAANVPKYYRKGGHFIRDKFDVELYDRIYDSSTLLRSVIIDHFKNAKHEVNVLLHNKQIEEYTVYINNKYTLLSDPHRRITTEIVHTKNNVNISQLIPYFNVFVSDYLVIIPEEYANDKNEQKKYYIHPTDFYREFGDFVKGHYIFKDIKPNIITNLFALYNTNNPSSNVQKVKLTDTKWYYSGIQFKEVIHYYQDLMKLIYQIRLLPHLLLLHLLHHLHMI